MPNKDCEQLQHEFVNGTAPRDLDGFYRGALARLMPATFLEHLGQVAATLYLPWRGKYFYKKKKSGDNIVPSGVQPLVAAKLGTKTIIRTDPLGLHVFPFKIVVTTSLFDNIPVLRLDYDLPQNPPRVRDVVDEVVRVGKNSYLGKAYLKEKNTYRTVAFFRLMK